MSALTNHDWQACPISDWHGDPARCRWCNGWLRGQQTLFCTLECKRQAVENHALATARQRVKTRDRRCTQCGTKRRLQVHHIRPCRGVRSFSCHHHLTNLELLCDLCHETEHRPPGELLTGSKHPSVGDGRHTFSGQQTTERSAA